MSFRFNFTCDDLELEETDVQDQPLESSLGDLSLEEPNVNKIASQVYDIMTSTLPEVIQADQVTIPGVSNPLYKRTLADVKFQLAQQDVLDAQQQTGDSDEVLDMLQLTGNSDLIRGVYEGGFKTWECSLDLVAFLAQLPEDQRQNKTVLELGCGSALPSLYLLQSHQGNQVDVQDYNSQVLHLITVPNILLNTILTPSAPQPDNATAEDIEDQPVTTNGTEQQDESGAQADEADDEEEVVDVMDDGTTCDAEADIPLDKADEMLTCVAQRSKAYFGDWESLPHQLGRTYDMVVTSETIYSQEALPSLIGVFQKALAKPHGVG
ncbi:hypothetical protein DM01DRAFT_1285960 [Hesseltinella vesiculosa]|uniref:protein-histidine N-methyltransferase n=1 Tax=Hesseltinella vesiculosa TaxID=101127 RepID=A0A1X2GJY6_9FUNG|nr:hypothetical protein DM01DRAFT_1285960 [Hesseltinella vesiculosa]